MRVLVFLMASNSETAFNKFRTLRARMEFLITLLSLRRDEVEVGGQRTGLKGRVQRKSQQKVVCFLQDGATRCRDPLAEKRETRRSIRA